MQSIEYQKKEVVKNKKINRAPICERSLVWRIELERLLKEKYMIKEICKLLKISRSALFHERLRMGSHLKTYIATEAHEHAQKAKRVNSKLLDSLPDYLKRNMSCMYRKIKNVMSESMSSKTKEGLKECIYLLEKMGLDPERLKRPVSIEEERKIMSLLEEGYPPYRICRIMNRSSNTVGSCIERNLKPKNTEENIDERFITKWTE